MFLIWLKLLITKPTRFAPRRFSEHYRLLNSNVTSLHTLKSNEIEGYFEYRNYQSDNTELKRFKTGIFRDFESAKYNAPYIQEEIKGKSKFLKYLLSTTIYDFIIVSSDGVEHRIAKEDLGVSDGINLYISIIII